jgi:hypothetical protein
MSDFNYTPSADLSLNGLAGGGRTYDLISPDVVEAAITSDRTGFCRMQPLAGQHKAAFTTYADLRHDRPHLLLDDQLRLLTEFTYTMPSHIPGTDGATTSSGTAQTDRGGLIVGFRGAGFRAACYIQKVTLGGAYGQTSTVGSPSLGFITTASASEVAVYAKTPGAYNVVLFPSGIAAGDTVRVKIIIGRFASDTDGYIRSWCVGEPFMPAAL